MIQNGHFGNMAMSIPGSHEAQLSRFVAEQLLLCVEHFFMKAHTYQHINMIILKVQFYNPKS